MKFFRHVSMVCRFGVLITAMLALQSCGMGGAFLKEADSVNSLSREEVIVVGTIELIPKLEEDDQDLESPAGVWDLFGVGNMNKNRAMIQFNSKPEVDGYKIIMNPELGKTFFFKVPRDHKYLVEAYVMTEFPRYGGSGKILLPMSFKVNIKPTDKAVYIGKIKYTRDDFNTITGVKLIDNYKKANKQFKKKFGSKYKLRKSLIKEI